jgi:hypothetical protein
LKVTPEDVPAALSDQEKSAIAEADSRIAQLKGQHKSWETIYAVYDTGSPPPTYLLDRGDHHAPATEVSPGVLSVLCNSEGDAVALSADSQGATSGRRLALARWLTAPDSRAAALVARVRVNRVWQHLFGKGLVATTDNFGHQGTLPTHPELLDWLANAQIQSGWRLKPLLKLILSSSAYQQGSVRLNGDVLTPVAMRSDPDNALLWHMPLRRLESEAVRDAILAASGKLDRTVGGPAVPLENMPDGRVVVAGQGLPTPTSQWRRSLYLLARRNYHPTFLAVFDQPVLTTNCTRRDTSAVVLQSLTMLNDAFVLEQAGFFAERVAREAGTTPEGCIERAFECALARKPAPEEQTWAAEFLSKQAEHYRSQPMPPEQADQQALASLCHMLLGTNEFLYVE